MLPSLATRSALVLALAVIAAPPARATDQTILGSQLVVKNPSTHREGEGGPELRHHRG